LSKEENILKIEENGKLFDELEVDEPATFL
jgi:hypothetical protein